MLDLSYCLPALVVTNAGRRGAYRAQVVLTQEFLVVQIADRTLLRNADGRRYAKTSFRHDRCPNQILYDQF
jgi:hypothetical protein